LAQKTRHFSKKRFFHYTFSLNLNGDVTGAVNRHQLVGYYPSFFLGRVPQEEWQQQHTVVSNDLNPPKINSPK